MADQHSPNSNLSPEERRLFGQVFSAADSEGIGVVTGDVALNFFPSKTKLPSEVLGEIWQIADEEDKGFLTPAGFGVLLRLIGYAQAGRPLSAELASKPGGPLPKLEGITLSQQPPQGASAPPLQAQPSGGQVKIPALPQDKANQYAKLFEESGAQNGLLSGALAKQIFDRAQLPNDVLVRIWNLADTEQKGLLNVTQFIIAMHLLASYRSGAMKPVPQTLPPALFDAAARRGTPRFQGPGSRPTSDVPSVSSIPKQFSGAGVPARTSSPLARPPQQQTQSFQAPSSPSTFQPKSDWAVTAEEKSQFDNIFTKVDTENRGFLTGEQAVTFFSNSRLSEEDLAQIWDLADINSEGQLNRDEFAVAMHLVRLQLGRRGGPSLLPQTLPANLIPPSMRRQPHPPQQSTAPAFDNAANFISKPAPKSAADDLFGLDALTDEPPQVQPQIPQSTGGSNFSNPLSPQSTGFGQPPPQAQKPQQSSMFKPFIPQSSFGQTIMTPQTTGTAGSSPSVPSLQNRGLPSISQHSAEDDLLGDNDPEVNNRLTQETTELANLSNQVGSLTNQMQQVKSKRASTDQDLTQVSTKKREFETRLSQLRAAYEQEVRDAKALEDKLTMARNETQKVQQDFASLQKSHQELQVQHQQVSAALESDKRENANIKETMRQINAEIGQLKPQVEKLRSDARQQKGLVAINKKQMSTIEAEREKIKQEMENAAREHEAATKELEESHQSLQALQQAPPPAPAPTPAPAPAPAKSPSPAASPTPSVTSPSTNPFFRRTTTGTAERGMAPSPFTPSQNVASPNHNAFNDFFGSAFGPPAEPLSAQNTGPPPTSFGESSAFPTQAAEPPPPPQLHQIASSFLPFRDNIPRSDSPSSSVNVAPPASRYGDESREASQTFSPPIGAGIETPDHKPSISSRTSSPSPRRQSPVNNESSGLAIPTISQPASNDFDDFGQPSVQRDIPGAFPGDLTPSSITPMPKSENQALNAGATQTQGPTSAAKDDFDSAFASFGNPKDSSADATPPKISPANTGAAQKQSEFPPIQELGSDDDSDSDSEVGGFGDDFTTASPPHKQQPPGLNGFARSPENNLVSHTEPEDASTSQPPTPGAQKSPPTYDSTFASEGITRRESNAFPKEFTGLLPSREAFNSPPTIQPSPSPDNAIRSPSNGDASNFFSPPSASLKGKERTASGTFVSSAQMPMAPGATAAPFAYQQPPLATKSPTPPVQAAPPPQAPSSNALQPPAHSRQPSAFDDFDDAFDDLSEAKEAEDSHDEPFSAASSHKGFDDFNPSFDSPAPSQRTINHKDSPAPAHNAFHDFDSSFNQNTERPPPGARFQPTQPEQASGGSGHDWDAMFAGLGNEPGKPSDSLGVFGSTGEQPPLARAISQGTEHDDPLLKELTSLGYSREESLRALEKYDYNIDKAADFLTSR